jgi:xanthine dehydrogenase molybdopterin-binding subunit B
MLSGLAKGIKVDIDLQMPATPEAILLAVEKIKK